ncbi:coiled-coil domain-containing protein 96 isoform X2 [Drosophila elegans]|nr:coiled-coil domain-containing protein 96 isoform X2 [Drosophila elegans]
MSSDSEYAPSAPASGRITPVSLQTSLRQRHIKKKISAGRSKRNSKHSVNSVSKKKSFIGSVKRLSSLSIKPPSIYKIKKLSSKENVQAIQFDTSAAITSSTDYEDSEDIEEDLYVQSEGPELTDQSTNQTINGESQISVSPDLDIRRRFDLLQGLRDIPDLEELGAIATPDLDQWIAGKEKDPLDVGRFRSPMARHSTSTLSSPLTESENEGITEAAWPPNLEPDAISLTSISLSEVESDDSSYWEPQRSPKLSLRPTFISDSSGSSEKSQPKPLVTLNICEDVENYLADLIEKVVEGFENADYVRTESLDKGKLLDRLVEEVDDNYWERYENEYLTKRLTEHHLRRSKYSLITPSTSAAHNEANRRRHLSALYELDHWLQREREAEDIHLAERDRLLAELKQKQSEDEAQVEELEELIRKNILRRAYPSDRLKIIAENTLRQMRKKRDEMSEVRLVLIIKQHNNSFIEQKLNELETISEEVTMDTYLSTETDVEQLAHVLSTRNAELLRMHDKIKNKVHSISHLRCRRKLLSRKFLEAKKELQNKQTQNLALRDKLFTRNIIHNKLHAKINEVRFRAGIMCYPKLLVDFDQTEKFILQKQDRVKELKAQHDSLLRRIDIVESKIQLSKLSVSVLTD